MSKINQDSLVKTVNLLSDTVNQLLSSNTEGVNVQDTNIEIDELVRLYEDSDDCLADLGYLIDDLPQEIKIDERAKLQNDLENIHGTLEEITGEIYRIAEELGADLWQNKVKKK